MSEQTRRERGCTSGSFEWEHCQVSVAGLARAAFGDLRCAMPGLGYKSVRFTMLPAESRSKVSPECGGYSRYFGAAWLGSVQQHSLKGSCCRLLPTICVARSLLERSTSVRARERPREREGEAAGCRWTALSLAECCGLLGHSRERLPSCPRLAPPCTGACLQCHTKPRLTAKRFTGQRPEEKTKKLDICSVAMALTG